MKQVSENALIQRINRRVGGYDIETATVWGERLHKARLYPGGYEDANVGRYYTVDCYSGFLAQSHLSLEQYGREVGALAPNEEAQA
jgi:hypothetical protein